MIINMSIIKLIICIINKVTNLSNINNKQIII
uniref:Uncharacterized protein n=1 Tax=viral metagenome TaxID=1070528 RepID=A0A6C0H9X5_9ZZZZ